MRRGSCGKARQRIVKVYMQCVDVCVWYVCVRPSVRLVLVSASECARESHSPIMYLVYLYVVRFVQHLCGVCVCVCVQCVCAVCVRVRCVRESSLTSLRVQWVATVPLA